MAHEPTRRRFLRRGSFSAGMLAVGSSATARDETAQAPGTEGDDPQAFPRFHFGRGGPIGSPSDRGKLTRGFRERGQPPVPVEMPDIPGRVPWTMVDGVKEYHLHAQVVQRELLPGQFFYVWGYNGSMPGPILEANQGDHVRIIVHNELPEPTTVHWHGLELPVGMDGVPGLTQEPIMPGKSFAYEFELHQEGTFFYHSHGPMQEIMGMVGMFVIHPREGHEPAVDHDFGLIFQLFAILPQSYVPNAVSDAFNWFTINGRSGPYTTPLVVRHGSRVRLRLLNFSAMMSHPIHLHGHTFWITGTEGGRIPDAAWVPRNTTNVHVAQVQTVEFIANNPGDWALHCHILHHMMNHMTSMTGPARMIMGGGHGGMGAGGMGTGALRPAGGGGLAGMEQGQGHGTDLGMAAGGRFQDLRAGHGAGGPGVPGFVRTVQLPAALEAAPAIGQPDSGPALSDEFGPALGHGLGPNTDPDHAARTGPAIGGPEGPGGRYHDPRWAVPGWPLDMMDMKAQQWTDAEKQKLQDRDEVQGMRRHWFTSVNGMMTTLRVLPDDLYEKVKAGRRDIPYGASIPGPGKDADPPKDQGRMG